MSSLYKVAFAEDDEAVRNLAASYLAMSHNDIDLRRFENGSELLKYARSNSDMPQLLFDMVITDKNMPIIDGIDAIKELRKLSGYRDTPIVMYSSSDDEVTMKRAQLAGSTEFISKTVNLEDMLELTIEKFLKKENQKAISEYRQRLNLKANNL